MSGYLTYMVAKYLIETSGDNTNLLICDACSSKTLAKRLIETYSVVTFSEPGQPLSKDMTPAFITKAGRNTSSGEPMIGCSSECTEH